MLPANKASVIIPNADITPAAAGITSTNVAKLYEIDSSKPAIGSNVPGSSLNSITTLKKDIPYMIYPKVAFDVSAFAREQPFTGSTSYTPTSSLAVNYINRLQLLSGAAILDAKKQRLDTLSAGIIADTTLATKLRVLHLFEGGTLDRAAVNFMNPNPNVQNNGWLTWGGANANDRPSLSGSTVKRTSATQTASINWNPTADGLNDVTGAHIGMWITDQMISDPVSPPTIPYNDQYMVGNYTSFYFSPSGGTVKLGDTSPNQDVPFETDPNFYLATLQPNASALKRFTAATQVYEDLLTLYTYGSYSRNAGPDVLDILGMNDGGTYYPSAAGRKMVCMGEGLTNAEVGRLYNLLNAYYA